MESVNGFARLVDMVRAFRQDEQFELEVVFSTIDLPGGGVPEALWNLLKSRAKQSVEAGVFDLICEDAPQKDAFFPDGFRSRCQKMGEATYIRKTRAAKVLATCPQFPTFRFTFHLKREEPHDIKEATYTEPPLSVRNQVVSEYRYKDMFVYSFKEVRQGKNPEEASKAPKKFEIEIEMLHNQTMLAERSDTYLAQSLMLKTTGICPNLDDNNEPQKLALEWEPISGSSNGSGVGGKTQVKTEPNNSTRSQTVIEDDLEPSVELPFELTQAAQAAAAEMATKKETKYKRKNKEPKEPKAKAPKAPKAPRAKKAPAEKKPRVKKEPVERKPRKKKESPTKVEEEELDEDAERALFQEALDALEAEEENEAEKEGEGGEGDGQTEEDEAPPKSEVAELLESFDEEEA